MTLQVAARIKWPTYSAYRPSEVNWLGNIPSHWDIKPLKQLTNSIMRGNAPEYVEDSSIFVLNQACIQWSGIIPKNKKYQALTNVTDWKGLLRKGDVVMNSTGTGTLGRIGVFNEEGTWIADGHVTIIRCQDAALHPIFAKYLLSTPLYQRYIYATLVSGSTNQVELSREGLRATHIIQPPLCEQQAIAAFLDHETAKIDALLAKKERLIALLTEKRTALITHAVTQGLDSTVPRKDSGVAWLGQIPKHWVIAPVYSRYNIQLGKMLNDHAVQGTAPAPYLRNTNIQWDYVDISDLNEMDFSLEERQKYNLKPGDLLVCEGGEVGRSAIWRGELQECFFQKAIHRVRPRTSNDEPRFLFYILFTAAHKGVFEAEGNRSTIIHLTAEKLKKYRFAFPSVMEQRAIVEYLDRETSKLDVITTKTEHQIGTLQEYRTTLISAAVTGQIDVQSALPHPV